jgi:hypothetical protein
VRAVDDHETRIPFNSTAPDGRHPQAVSVPAKVGIFPGMRRLALVSLLLAWFVPAAHAATITLGPEGNLQAALDAARPGDTIVLQAGATYVGPFTLPRKEGRGWITVRGSGRIPAAGRRLTPASAGGLPKLLSPGRGEPALQTAPGAHDFRLVGLEFAPRDASALVYDLVRLGDGSSAQDAPAAVPQRLVLDRVYIHASSTGELKRGVALNSGDTRILNSTIVGFKGKGYDTQAIAGWNGPGPFVIENNLLEGAGENLMFGGADPSIPGLVPSRITIRHNLLRKPLAWRGVWTVKNLLELKNARRVLIDGNVLENNWADGQNGNAVLFTVRNQDGTAPWSVVEHVRFTNNVVRHTGSALNVLGHDDNNPSRQTNHIVIANNLFQDVDAARWSGGQGGTFLTITDSVAVSIDHNTVSNTGNDISAYGAPSRGFVFTNNVLPHNAYGVHGDGAGSGTDTLTRYFPGASFRRNVIAGAPAGAYPPDNFYPPSLAAAGRHAGTDGKQVGVDLAALRAHLR